MPLEQIDHLAVAQLEIEPLVGRDAPFVGLLGVVEAMDVLAAGTPVAGSGQFQGAAAVLQFDDPVPGP